jgi:hypothetical protein
MKNLIKALAYVLILLIVVSACSGATVEPTAVPTETAGAMDSMDNMGDMGDGEHVAEQFAPLVGGIYEDGSVSFIHTETSDEGVATMLTEMMGGPEVVLVPELADLPSSALADLYVFTNGLEGMGPFGFQQDIFDSIPGDDGYRPFRNVLLVEWNEGQTARELRTVAQVQEAETNGEVTISEPGIVVNFPVMIWPDGSRAADGTMDGSTQQYAPLVGGLYEGGEVLFVHTETSDPDVTTMLTEMMGGPEVFLVPELADAPPSALATLYVFTNGLSDGLDGYGPFGFQRDIFDSVPGDEAYRPLRNVLLVAWNDGETPRELLSVADLKEAETNGEVMVSEPGIVVNFPVLLWPDGTR